MITVKDVAEALCSIDSDYSETLGGWFSAYARGSEVWLTFEPDDENPGCKQAFSLTIQEEAA